jgi:cell division septal protein FtsQ
MPVSAPADKRFRRSHVRPTRHTPWRSRWLKRLAGAAIVVALAFSVFGVAGYALSSKRLAIQHIEVRGNVRISNSEVRALLSDLIGTNVLTADIGASLDRLRRDSKWVADAEIRRVFPASVAVGLTEKRAFAIARDGEDLHLIDQTGIIIDSFGPDYAEFDLPVVNGLVSSPGAGLLIDLDRFALARRALGALQPRPDLAKRVSEIDVSDQRDVVFLLNDDTALIHVGADHFLERLQTYVELASTLRQRVPDIDHVDMRYMSYGGRVYVRPRHQERAVPQRRGDKR